LCPITGGAGRGVEVMDVRPGVKADRQPVAGSGETEEELQRITVEGEIADDVGLGHPQERGRALEVTERRVDLDRNLL
jgi:hypothetical protein